MAVDTRNRRASIVGLAIAARLILPAPDASVVQADRQQTAYCYTGLAASAFGSADTIVLVSADDMIVRIFADDMVVLVIRDDQVMEP